jgi:pyridoxine 4-dehydrogenase
MLIINQTGQYKSYEDLGDSYLKRFPRFQPEVFDENIKLVEEVEKIALKKSVLPVQIAIGWVLARSGKKGFPVIIPIPGATTSERIKENMRPAELNEDDLEAIDEILKKFPPVGNRYPPEGMKHTNG